METPYFKLQSDEAKPKRQAAALSTTSAYSFAGRYKFSAYIAWWYFPSRYTIWAGLAVKAGREEGGKRGVVGETAIATEVIVTVDAPMTVTTTRRGADGSAGDFHSFGPLSVDVLVVLVVRAVIGRAMVTETASISMTTVVSSTLS